MHIWYLEDWKKNIDLTEENHRYGLRLKFDTDVDPSVRVFFKNLQNGCEEGSFSQSE